MMHIHMNWPHQPTFWEDVMSFARFVALAIICWAVLVGCSITRTVRPVENTRISELCIQENKDILMDGFLPELQSQIQSHGIMTRVFQNTGRL